MQKEACEQCIILEKRIEELEKRLQAYENAHTPPSKNQRNYPKRESTGNPIGAPKGHQGTTRINKDPDEIIEVKQDKCSKCYAILGSPIKIEKKLVEEIPEPVKSKTIQYNLYGYLCNCCGEINLTAHKDIPSKGRFGYNLMAEVALMKYEDRLPLRKIADNLNRRYSLEITPSSVQEILNRITKSCEPEYKKIKQMIRNSKNAFADETGQKVQGRNLWNWVFTTLNYVLFLVGKNRSQRIIEEVLGKNYRGILNCDGFKPYSKKVKQIQRCWAHLLREAKFLAEKHEGQARLLYTELCEVFSKIKQLKEKKLASKKREIERDKLVIQMKQLIARGNAYTQLRKFSTKIENGLEHWFTCVVHPEIEPTNNRAERALRELVVQRKITGTLRNEKGTHIMEVLMSLIGTWKLQELNPQVELRKILAS
jgi:transposase